MLKKTSINIPLLLDDAYFTDNQCNIDLLVERACNKANNQLEILHTAAKLAEKFHSYFHYEETYFHMQYGDLLYARDEVEAAIGQYKLAIFQDHLNSEAHIKLINCYNSHGEKDKAQEAKNYASSLNVSLEGWTPAKRPFTNFQHYVLFATNRVTNSTEVMDKYEIPAGDNFWASFLSYEKYQEERFLLKAMEQLKLAHQLYHKNAAVIYYNCSLAYEAQGDIALAKNALEKARNLDVNL